LSRPVVEFCGDVVEVGLCEVGDLGAFGEGLAEQTIGVFVAATLPGLRGSQKKTGTPVFTLNCACAAISLP
jgi:hypothetical protein